jgi:hypothetical protein
MESGDNQQRQEYLSIPQRSFILRFMNHIPSVEEQIILETEVLKVLS